MQILRILLLVALIASAIGLPSASSAQNQRRHPIHGASGDGGRDLTCPANMYLIGLIGKTGGWIDRVAIVCGRVGADGRVDNNWRSGPVGGNGGSLKSAPCIDGMVVNGISIQLTDDSRMVYSLGLNCFAIYDGATDFASLSGTYVQEERGFLEIGDSRAPPMPVTQTCLRGHVATGLTLRYGKHVNAAGLICDKLVVPAAAPAPPPPPKRQISSKGRAPGTSALSTSSNRVGQFDLPFESESSLGGKFDIKLQVVGMYQNPMRAHVTGTLTNTDIGPEYNGTFDGFAPMSDTRTVTLNYTQPAANAHGKVVFRFSEDGETFTGEGKHMGTIPFQWTGRRKRGPN